MDVNFYRSAFPPHALVDHVKFIIIILKSRNYDIPSLKKRYIMNYEIFFIFYEKSIMT